MEGQNCVVCGSVDAGFRCGACKMVYYCNAEHQRQDWKEGGHRNRCRTSEGVVRGDYGKIDEMNAHTVKLSVMESFLHELVDAYGKKGFQATLEDARRRSDFMSRFAGLVAKVQYPILAKYGFEASPVGVNVMKQAVLHAIIRGGERIRELADEACRLLQLPPLLPAVTPEIMAQNLNDVQSWKSSRNLDDLRASLRAYARVAGSADPEGVRLLLERVNSDDDVVTLFQWLRMAGTRFPPRLWFRREPEVKHLHKPSREELFSHVLANRPVLISGAMTAENFPPLKLFNDRDFLRRVSGHHLVHVKGKSFDRDGRHVFMMDPGLKMPFRDYLDQKDAGLHYYMGKVTLKDNLPEMLPHIDAAPGDVRKQFGDCFGKMIDDGVFTYFGLGANTSSTHYDPHENLMVCLSGTKVLELFPMADVANMYVCRPPSLSNSAVPPFCKHDDPVVSTQFPRFLQTQPIRVEVNAGDILYLPIFWWHSVSSKDGQNVILNYWFDCHSDKLLPISKDDLKGILTSK